MTGSGPQEADDADSLALFAQSVLNARPNVMIVAAPTTVARMVSTLSLDLRRRIVERHAAAPESWPVDGTSVLLRDIETLDHAQQEHLIAWLNHSGRRTHLITAVGQSLYPEVKRGRFLDTLFYRLNVIQLRLS